MDEIGLNQVLNVKYVFQDKAWCKFNRSILSLHVKLYYFIFDFDFDFNEDLHLNLDVQLFLYLDIGFNIYSKML